MAGLSYSPFFDSKKDYNNLNEFEKLKHNILRLLLTEKGTDPDDMHYGINKKGLLFALVTDDMIENIKNDIDESLSLYEPEYYDLVETFVSFFKPNIFNKRFISIEVSLFNLTDRKVRIMIDTTEKRDYVIDTTSNN